MTYTYEIKEVLNLYAGTRYKMIELRITIGNPGLFINGALPYGLKITDGTNETFGFYCEISGNQKELITFFTVDAFSLFSSSSEIIFGYASIPDSEIISGVDVTAIPLLSAELEIIPHQIADDLWLSSL